MSAHVSCKGSSSVDLYEQNSDLSFQMSIKDDDVHFFQTEGSVGGRNKLCDSTGVEAKLGSSIIRAGDEYSDIKVISGAIGSELKASWDNVSAKVEAGLNLVEAEVVGIKGNLGVSADSGVSVGGGSVEANLAG